MQCIYFGVTGEEYVKDNIDKWITLAGVPVIFSERDSYLKNYSSKLLGKYDVISADEAIKRYPDADIWVTFRNVGWVANWLAKRISPDRIHFLEADLEYRKGCEYLGNQILYRENSFSPCCSTGQGPLVRTSGTVRQRLSLWHDYTSRLITSVQHGGSENNCQKCHLLKTGFWRKSIKLNSFTFGVNHQTDVCNFKCIYCHSAEHLDSKKEDTGNYRLSNVLTQLSELPEYNTEELAIRFGNGEFCAYKHCDEILDIFQKTKWKMTLYSNCSIYKKQIADLMDSGRIRSLITSLDAGTRETFKKIKQRDMFDKVVDNLRRYPTDKTSFYIKYIFLEDINDNETEVDRFYEIAKDLNSNIILSSNFVSPYTGKMKDLALRIITNAKSDGIKVFPDTTYVQSADSKFIQESYANA